ncbi:MAG: polysaccharide biosynthesis/export family protein, partial [Acidobacteriia bacterium]|nr:polysaccharide biosynthesis/export family protein [Terriglobia bacterium]
MNAHGARAAILAAGLALSTLGACSGLDQLPPAPMLEEQKELQLSNYRIGSGDSLSIFVWRNPELSTGVPVRPDGKITTPLIEDLPTVGKTPTELARDIEKALGNYIQDPIVTVIVNGFVGLQQDQVRVVGEAQRPQALPYRS